MTLEVLNPTYGEENDGFVPATRLATLEGMTVGIVSNGKQGTGRFFAAFSDRLKSAHGVATVELVVKPNYSAPAGAQIMDEAQRWNALVSGIGD